MNLPARLLKLSPHQSLRAPLPHRPASIINPCCRSPPYNLLPWRSPARGETPRSAKKNQKNKQTWRLKVKYLSSTTLWVSPRIPLGFFFLFNQTLEETSGAKRWTQARKAADVHFKWCISNLNFSPAAPFSASWPWICSTEDGWADALLYLRHLGEQADGHGQRQAEGNQAHHAVDGQQQSAMALQKSQPTRVKTGIKKTQKGKHEPSVWIDPGRLQRVILGYGRKNLMCGFGGAIFHN